MELILATPIEELIPAMICWNNSELLNEVKGSIEKYKGIVYDDNQIAQAKTDKATLNNFVKNLNDERIRISKLYLKPYEDFKIQVDEVINLVKETSTEIDTQVKAYDENRQKIKREDIKNYFDGKIGEFSTVIEFEQIFENKWLNTTATLKNVYKEIDLKINTIKNDLIAIELLNSPDELAIKSVYFRTLSFAAAVSENAKLQAQAKRIADFEAERKAAAVPTAPIAQEPTQATVQTTTVEEKPVMTTINFSVTATAEQFKALRAFLIANKIQIKQI